MGKTRYILVCLLLYGLAASMPVAAEVDFKALARIAPEQRVAIQSTANVHIPTANAAPSNSGIGNGSHSPSNTPSTYNPAKINMGCFIN